MFIDRNGKEKVDGQVIGSAMTYARKYSLAAMAGVAPDEDDDGNGATNRDAKPQQDAPDGFDNWLADITIVAREQGTVELKRAWEKSPAAMRNYFSTVRTKDWEALKLTGHETTSRLAKEKA